MVLSDLRQKLCGEGFGDVPTHVIRFAINARHISRPPLNGSLQFDFQDKHVREVRTYLKRRAKRSKAATTA